MILLRTKYLPKSQNLEKNSKIHQKGVLTGVISLLLGNKESLVLILTIA
jgi:hypothetical protein